MNINKKYRGMIAESETFKHKGIHCTVVRYRSRPEHEIIGDPRLEPTWWSAYVSIPQCIATKYNRTHNTTLRRFLRRSLEVFDGVSLCDARFHLSYMNKIPTVGWTYLSLSYDHDARQASERERVRADVKDAADQVAKILNL